MAYILCFLSLRREDILWVDDANYVRSVLLCNVIVFVRILLVKVLIEVKYAYL